MMTFFEYLLDVHCTKFLLYIKEHSVLMKLFEIEYRERYMNLNHLRHNDSLMCNVHYPTPYTSNV